MRSKHHYFAAALGAISIIATSALAPGSASGSPTRGRQLAFASATAEPVELFGPDPELCNSATGRCLVPYAATEAVTGDIVGVAVSAGTLSIDPTTGIGDATSLTEIRGIVEGCPAHGTALLRFIARLGVSPATNEGTFIVLSGRGTGGLTTLRGSGSFTATVNPDQTVTGNFNAHLSCRHGR